MSASSHDEQAQVLRALLALVETEEAILEHGDDPLSREPGWRESQTRVLARLRQPSPPDPAASDDADGELVGAGVDFDAMDAELWLLLEGERSAQYRSAAQEPAAGPVSATDPATGATITVRPGESAGSWRVRLEGVPVGRYRVVLAWEEPVASSVQIDLDVTSSAGAGRTVAGQGSAVPTRVRIIRLDA